MLQKKMPLQVNWISLKKNRIINNKVIFNDTLNLVSTENAFKYYENILKNNFNLNEGVINFSLLSLLDIFGYQVGPGLDDRSVFDFTFLADKREEIRVSTSSSTFGDYDFILSWENGSYGNGERSNVYNAVREILGKDYSGGELGAVFRVMDWLILNSIHDTGVPYVVGHELNSIEEEELLHSLPNPAFVPSFYTFVPKEVGGVNIGTSRTITGALTSALRVLGLPSEQFSGGEINPDNSFNRNYITVNYFEEVYPYNGVRGPSHFNFGFLLLEGVPWFYEGNSPLGQGKARFAYETLIPQSDFSTEILLNILTNNPTFLSVVNYFSRRVELKSEYERIFGSSD